EEATGNFVVEGQPIASVSADSPVSDAEQTDIDGCYAKEHVRTIEQDVAFGIQQIVDIALKALSPGINDQTTAIMCIDRLAELMTRLADRRIRDRFRRVDGSVRLIVAAP